MENEEGVIVEEMVLEGGIVQEEGEAQRYHLLI